MLQTEEQTAKMDHDTSSILYKEFCDVGRVRAESAYMSQNGRSSQGIISDADALNSIVTPSEQSTSTSIYCPHFTMQPPLETPKLEWPSVHHCRLLLMCYHIEGSQICDVKSSLSNLQYIRIAFLKGTSAFLSLSLAYCSEFWWGGPRTLHSTPVSAWQNLNS